MDASEEVIGQQHDAARQPRRDVFLFSHPRTASNLLCRLLSDQPGWIQSEYHFQDAFKFARKSFGWGPLTDVDAATRQEFERLLQNGFNNLQKVRDAAIAQDVCLLVKNHVFHLWEPSSLSQSIWGGGSAPPFTLDRSQGAKGAGSPISTNATFLDDEFLVSWLPVFLIRHPALVFESWYKAESRIRSVDLFDKSWAYVTTFRYSRQLYDWFNSKLSHRTSDMYSPEPIIIDADDIIEGQSLERLCELCNMDPSFIRYEWDATVIDEGRHSPRHRSYLDGLWNSTSIDKSKTSEGLNMVNKYLQWKMEFGEEVADILFELVENSMEDYVYLRDRRI